MFGDRFYQCFSRIKRPSHSTRRAAMIPRSAIAAASASSCSSSAVLYKNFNSLYDPVSDSETTTLTLPLSSSRAAGGSSFSSSGDACVPDEAPVGGSGGSCPSERDLSTAIASHRLLLASPGNSNSIVDSAVVAVGVGSGVAVPTYSPDPYWEFRRSMEEMVAALKLDARKHRAHLHELLLCYLALNRKQAHKYIVGAFTDLLLGLTAAAADE